MTHDFLNGQNPDDIARAAALLAAGEVVAVPTETVYGLAADALNEAAVRKVFDVKGRPLIDPLIVHVADWADVEKIAQPTPQAKILAERFWPGPLTMVLRKRPCVPDVVTANRPTVAVRMPAHTVMRAILQACQRPLAAPSANPFGYISPTTAAHVRDSLKEGLPWIVDGGPCTHGVESTIVDLSDEAKMPRILRHGPVTAEALAAALKLEVADLTPEQPAQASQSDETGLAAPGLLKRHYSPHTTVELLEAGGVPTDMAEGRRAAWVMLKRPRKLPRRPARTDVFFLSEDGDLETVAHNVFALLRALDKGCYDAIFVEQPPAEGIGMALRDRLKRAAAR